MVFEIFGGWLACVNCSEGSLIVGVIKVKAVVDCLLCAVHIQMMAVLVIGEAGHAYCSLKALDLCSKESNPLG